MNHRRAFSTKWQHSASTLVLTLALTHAGSAFADSVFWNGGTSTDWFTDTNWVWDGHAPGAADTARIDSVPSAVITGSAAAADTLFVGVNGTAGLAIQSSLATATATLGYNLGSTATVTVSGPSAAWTTSGFLYVGNGGAGTLTLSGQATAGGGTVYLGAAPGGAGTLNVGGESRFTAAGTLFVGYGGTGTLAITSGTVASAGAVVADGVGSSGTATVAGSTSSWTNTGVLVVGGGGGATLTISDGGTTTTNGLTIGNLASATGSWVTVTGTGSNLDGGDLFVGVRGAATLQIEDGGTATSGYSVIGRHSVSSATVTGAESSWATGALVIGGDQADPGTSGTGTLNLQAGGTVSSASARLGDVVGSSGTAIIDAASWTVTDRISVGMYGTGALTLQNGATVTSAGGLIGHEATGTGTVTITGPGSTWTNTGTVYVGNVGDGTLTVSAGGRLTSLDGYVGTESGSTSTATITGTNSAWVNSGDVLVGHNAGATGTVTISAGATISDVQGLLGDLAGSSGTMTVTGAGSTWTSTSDVNVGRFGTGNLTVSNGGAVTGNRAYIANEAGSSGTAVVTGAGSLWQTTNRLFVGTEGTGTLTVSDGGTVRASEIVVGYAASSAGTLNIGAAAGDAAAEAGTLDTSIIRFGTGTGHLVFNFTDPSYVFDTAITGAGSINLVSGNLTLAAASSYSGGTTVGNGTTLTLGTSTAAGSGTITLNGTSTLAYAAGISVANALLINGTANLEIDSGAAYQTGVIFGSGSYNLTGGGTLYLTGDSSGFTGTTAVLNGTLSVNGLLGNSVIVSSSGTLKGSGTIGGSVTVSGGGTVAPGNSIGTLTVLGSYTQAAGSTYEVELDASGASDRIAVTGTATLGGTLAVSSATGSYAVGTRYTILTAAGGIADGTTYAGILNGGAISAFLGVTDTYAANAVYLDVVQTRALASAAITRNQIAAATAADTLGSGALFNALASLPSDAAARAAFDTVAGDIHPSAHGVLIENSRFVRTAAIDRVRAAFGAAGASSAPVMAYADAPMSGAWASMLAEGSGRGLAPAAAAIDRFALWGSTFGSWGATGSDGNAASLDRATGGFLLGGDAPVFETWRVGGIVGYSRTTFDTKASAASSNSDDYHVGVYGGTRWGALGLRTGVAYTWHDISTARPVALAGFRDTPTASYAAGTTQAFGELGYGLAAGAAVLEPFANLAYVDHQTERFAEQGSSAALTSASTASGVTFTTIGLHASSAIPLGSTIAIARGTLGWRHAFGDTTPVSNVWFSGANAFAVAGLPIAENTLVGDIGLDVAITPTATIGIAYGGQFSDGATDQTINGNLTVRF